MKDRERMEIRPVKRRKENDETQPTIKDIFRRMTSVQGEGRGDEPVQGEDDDGVPVDQRTRPPEGRRAVGE